MGIFFDTPFFALAVAGALTGLTVTLGIRRVFGRGASAFIRIFTVLFALFAVSSPSILATGSPPRIVFLIDESPSMTAYMPAVERFIRQSTATFPRSCLVDAIGFSGDERVILDGVRGGTDRPVTLTARIGRPFDPIAALNAAYFRIPADSSGIVVFYTDGKFDISSTPPPPPQHISVVLRPLPPVDASDVAITSISLPTSIAAGETASARIGIFSNINTRAHLIVLLDDMPVHTTDIYVTPGSIEHLVPVFVAQGGTHKVTAKITSEAPDSFISNDIFERAISVRGRPRVAVLHGEEDAEEAEHWRNLIGENAYTTTAIETLSAVGGVVVVNLPSERLPRGIESFVRRGGSLLITGGERAFDDGYKKVGYEVVSPLTPDSSGGKNTDIVFLIDKSGSLDRPLPASDLRAFSLVKMAVAATLDLTNRRTGIGCIAFDADEPRRLFGITNFIDKTALSSAQEAIAALSASGGTNLARGLNSAIKMLDSSKAERRNLVVFFDGETEGGNYIAEAERIKEMGVKVHWVAVGNANYDVLNALAKATDGRVLPLAERDWMNLPAVFKKLVEDATGDRVRVGSFDVATTEISENILQFKSILPDISAYNSTEAADNAKVLANCSSTAQPLIAVKTLGLGRTGAFASSLSIGWAENWLQGSGQNLLYSLCSYIFPSDAKRSAWLSIEERGSKVFLRADVFDDDGNPLLNRRVVVRIPGSEREKVELLSTNSGSYSALINLPRGVPFTGQLFVDDTESGEFALFVSGAGEYGVGEYRPERLRALAEALHGRFIEGPIEIRRAFPGRKSLLPILGLFLCILILIEAALAIPAVRRFASSLWRNR